MVPAINLDLSGLKEAVAAAVKEGVEKAHTEAVEAGYVRKEDVVKMVEERLARVQSCKL